MSIDRRLFLGRTAWAGLGAAAMLVAAPARAIRIEDGDPAREAMIRAACESRQTHDSLMKELVAQLEPKEGRAQAEAEVRRMACPLCGCRLAAETGADED